MVLLSCNAFRILPTQKDEPADDKVKSPEVVKVEVDTIVKIKTPKPEKTPTEKVDFFGKEYEVSKHKTAFKIALIMPFFYNPSTDLEKRTSDIMLDYYTGVKIALNSLDTLGLKLKVYVYDNKNDTNILKRILSKQEMTSMDIIVGPIREDQMQIVSAFGAKNKIGVISPFTGMSSLSGANSLFYSTSPNLQTKAKNMVSFWEKKHKNKKLIIIRDGSGYDKEFVPVLINELNKSGKIKFSQIAQSQSTNWFALLPATDTTCIYLPSHQSTIVNSMLGKIVSVKRNVIVFGEGSWAEFEDNDYHFWTKLHVHLFATDYIDYEQDDVKVFRKKYRDAFNHDPNLYAYLGHDQFRFIGDFLNAFGELYPNFINDNNFRYLSSSFKFNLRNGFNQNTNMFILGFRDMKLQLVE